MLCDLIIKNFAIVEQLHVNFNAGFNVLTGETGAGKSIIIDAVNLLLGGRARGEVIRTGTDEATVEAIPNTSNSAKIKNQIAKSPGSSLGSSVLVSVDIVAFMCCVLSTSIKGLLIP